MNLIPLTISMTLESYNGTLITNHIKDTDDRRHQLYASVESDSFTNKQMLHPSKITLD